MMGHFDLVKHMRARDFPVEHDQTMGMAAAGGHFEMVKWMHLNDFPEGEVVLEFACEGNQEKIIEYLCNHPPDCPKEQCQKLWDKPAAQQMCGTPPPGRAIVYIGPKSFAQVARNGNLKMLTFLYQCHGDWDATSFDHLVSQLPGLPPPYENIDEKNDPEEENRAEQLATILYENDCRHHDKYLQCLRFLVDHHCPKPKIMDTGNPIAYVPYPICSMLFDECAGLNCDRCVKWRMPYRMVKGYLDLILEIFPPDVVGVFLPSFANVVYWVSIVSDPILWVREDSGSGSIPGVGFIFLFFRV